MQMIYKQLAADKLATWGYHRSRWIAIPDNRIYVGTS